MTTERSRPSTKRARAMAIIEGGVADLIAARDFTGRFYQLIQRRKHTEIEPWVADATSSMMASFAVSITRDQAAVQAAMTAPSSTCSEPGSSALHDFRCPELHHKCARAPASDGSTARPGMASPTGAGRSQPSVPPPGCRPAVAVSRRACRCRPGGQHAAERSGSRPHPARPSVSPGRPPDPCQDIRSQETKGQAHQATCILSQ